MGKVGRVDRVDKLGKVDKVDNRFDAPSFCSHPCLKPYAHAVDQGSSQDR